MAKTEPEDSLMAKTEPEDSLMAKTEPEDSLMAKTEPEDSLMAKTEPEDSLMATAPAAIYAMDSIKIGQLRLIVAALSAKLEEPREPSSNAKKTSKQPAKAGARAH
nr:hypothetical protein BaRGS_012377 [Batillaria attramentaria]